MLSRYEAKARQGDNKFEYVCTQGQHTWPIGYDGNPDLVPEEFRSNCHTTGHDTEAEAYACYKNYVLDCLLLLDQQAEDLFEVCSVCGAVSDKMAVVGHMHRFVLCPTHMLKDTVATLFQVGSRTSQY